MQVTETGGGTEVTSDQGASGGAPADGAVPVPGSTADDVAQASPVAAEAGSEGSAGPAGTPPSADGLPSGLGRNVGINYVATAIGSLSAFVLTPVLLHHLGPEAFGIWLIAGSVVAYIQMFDMGFRAASVKMMAADAWRRPAEVVRTFNTNLAPLTALALVAMVAGVAIAFQAPDWFHAPDELRDATRTVFLILTVSFGVSIPLDVLGGVLIAHNRLYLLSVSNLVMTLGTTLGSIVMVLIGYGLVEVAAITAAITVAVHALRWRMARGLVPELRFSWRLVERARLRRTTALSGWFLIRDAAYALINNIDVVIVGALIDLEAAAIYGVGLKLAQISRRALEPLTFVFFPHASSLAAEDDKHRLAGLYVDGTRVSLLVMLPIMLVLVVLADPALTAWVGPEYGFGGERSAVPVLIVMAAARGVSALGETGWTMLLGSGWERRAAVAALVEAAVKLASSVVLGMVLGIVGVALGTLVGALLVNLPASLLTARRATGTPVHSFARRALVPHVLPTLVTAGVLALSLLVVERSVVLLLAAAAAGVLVYFAAYVVISSTEPERDRLRRLRNSVRRRLSREKVA